MIHSLLPNNLGSTLNNNLLLRPNTYTHDADSMMILLNMEKLKQNQKNHLEYTHPVVRMQNEQEIPRTSQ